MGVHKKKVVPHSNGPDHMIIVTECPESNRQVKGESKESFTYKAGRISDNYGGFLGAASAVDVCSFFLPPDRTYPQIANTRLLGYN